MQETAPTRSRLRSNSWWTGEDSNLRSSQGAADLQSAAINHSATCPIRHMLQPAQKDVRKKPSAARPSRAGTLGVNLSIAQPLNKHCNRGTAILRIVWI